MKDCPQTKGQSILEHGFSVKNYLFDIINHLETNSILKYNWKIPNWVYDNRDLILKSLPDKNTLKLYTIFHDCGKWQCLKTDEDGKNHFPNHSEYSYNIFKDLFNNEDASLLIKHDMDIHLLKSDNIDKFCNKKFAITLLLSGLAEINSNANMFGGFESTSFKIKFKSITKNGNKIFKNITKKNN